MRATGPITCRAVGSRVGMAQGSAIDGPRPTDIGANASSPISDRKRKGPGPSGPWTIWSMTSNPWNKAKGSIGPNVSRTDIGMRATRRYIGPEAEWSFMDHRFRTMSMSLESRTINRYRDRASSPISGRNHTGTIPSHGPKYEPVRPWTIWAEPDGKGTGPDIGAVSRTSRGMDQYGPWSNYADPISQCSGPCRRGRVCTRVQKRFSRQTTTMRGKQYTETSNRKE